MAFVGSDQSDPTAAFRSLPGPAAAAARVRLSGTVWRRVFGAETAYRGFYASGVLLGRIGITANSLTYLSVVFAIGSAVAAATGLFALAGVAVIFAGLCDALDGIVARTTGTVSPYGALLDSTVDRVVDALPLLGLMLFYAAHPLFAIVPAIALLSAVVIPYARARAESLGAKLPSLFMRRPERVVLLIASLLLGGVRVAPGESAPLLLGGIALLSVLSIVGGVALLRAAHRTLSPRPSAASSSDVSS